MNRIADYLNNKSILLLGFGREGQSSYHFIRKYLKNNPICIADKNIHLDKSSFADEHLYFVLGDNYLDNINDFDNIAIKHIEGNFYAYGTDPDKLSKLKKGIVKGKIYPSH